MEDFSKMYICSFYLKTNKQTNKKQEVLAVDKLHS